MAPKKGGSAESDEDIPFKKNDKVTEPEEEGEDEEEEEYAVEKIISHKWTGKGKNKLMYKVKWVGYEETSEEPEQNLDNCPEELETYFKLIGGKPEPSSGPASAKKRTVSETATPQAKGRPSANKKAKTEEDSSMVHAANGEGQWKAPAGSWEDHILAVDSMTRDDDGDNIVYLVWNNKQKSRHSTKLLNHKCPQKLLAFYEAHLFFNPVRHDEEEDVPMKDIAPSSSKGSGNVGKAAAAPEKNGASADDEEDEEMEGVKGVATTA